MSRLAPLALALGLASIGFNLYAVIETGPNYHGSEKRLTETPSDSIERRLNESYRQTMKQLAYGAASAGALAAVAGGVAGAKGKNKLGWGGLALGLAGLGWQFAWAV